MSLSTIFSESDIKSLLGTFSEDSKYQIIEYLDDVIIDTKGRKNILGLYEFDLPEEIFDGLKEEIANNLTEKMNKLIRVFSIDMILLLNNTEAEFKQKIKEMK